MPLHQSRFPALVTSRFSYITLVPWTCLRRETYRYTILARKQFGGKIRKAAPHYQSIGMRYMVSTDRGMLDIAEDHTKMR